MKRTITALALSAIVVLGMTACSSEQTPEPPVRSDVPSTSAPAETPSESETETPAEVTQTPAPVEEERDAEGNLVWMQSGSVFDVTQSESTLPDGAVELWGEDRSHLASIVAFEALFAGIYTTSAWDEGERVITDFEFLTNLMTPEAQTLFTEAFNSGDADGWVWTLAPSGRTVSNTEGEAILTVAVDAQPEVTWDGNWETEVVSDESIYGDSEARFVVRTTYDYTFVGTTPDGDDSTVTERRSVWVALVPQGDSWGVDRWGYSGEVVV